MEKARLFYRSKSLLVCTACRWHCRIPPGLVGLCSARANMGKQLYLLTHSRAASYHADPIEKKPLFHFLPGSLILSLGTCGCNFGCEFCQNWEISQASKTLGTKKAVEIKKFIDKNSGRLPPAKIAADCLAQDIPAIAFTYNEPTIFAEYAYDTMKLAKKHNIYGVFVSSGYESEETLNLLEGYIDAYNIDFKGATEEFYQKVCHTKLAPVLETMAEIYRRKKWLEVTTLLIPGLNTQQKDLKFIAGFIAGISKDIPWHVTAFYPHYKMTNRPPAGAEMLRRAYEIGREAGLRYVYSGNIPGLDYESTFCPNCKQLLIARRGYNVRVEGLDLQYGQCQKCHEQIPGVFRRGNFLSR